jgi:hypothetical protein
VISHQARARRRLVVVQALNIELGLQDETTMVQPGDPIAIALPWPARRTLMVCSMRRHAALPG